MSIYWHQKALTEQEAKAAQLSKLEEIRAEVEMLQEQQDARDESQSENHVDAWIKARQFAVSKGIAEMPKSKKKVIDKFQKSSSLSAMLCRENPALAKAIGIDDSDQELPLVIIELLANPTAEPSVELGRKLLDAGPIDDLCKLAPQRATTIRLSAKQWNEDQAILLKNGLEALQEKVRLDRVYSAELKNQYANPLAASQAWEKENKKREILRAAGIEVGPRF